MRLRPKMLAAGVLAAAALVVGTAGAATPGSGDWGQWGQNAQHQGFVPFVGQNLNHILDDVVYDPFSNKENTSEGTSVHYQTALIDGQDVYMEFKTGNFSTLKNWETQVWNENKFTWQAGKLVQVWSFTSDWNPVPYSKNPLSGPTWEPVFHGVLANASVYVPGAGGTVFRLDKANGSAIRINPFGSIDKHTFVAGALSADDNGNVYYNALRLDSNHPWDQDIQGAWLVKIAPDDTVKMATWASITPGTPAPTDPCTVNFSTALLPWPPSPNAVAPTVPCMSQRPGINVAPAIAPDGTIYDISRAHGTNRWGYLIAVNPNLTSKWVASLRNRFNDGCNVEDPPNPADGGCREGAPFGVDPAENQPGSGRVLDESTASPTVAPDGSVFYGAYTRYNYAQGHLMHFDSSGAYLGSYHFGWDLTPAIYQHGETYSVVIKDNHYGNVGSYCNDPTYCPPDRNASNPSYPEEYFITQLSPGMSVQWKFKNTNTLSCTRNEDGTVTCINNHPNSFEWCINAPAIDANGTVYATSEDGNLYAINNPNGTLKQQIFLDIAVEAAYTPVSIGADGKIYAQNFGHLVVVGT